MSKTIKLLSSDGVSYEIPFEVARVSDTLGEMLEKFENGVEGVIELKMVKSNVLEKVIQWCSHHRDDTEDEDEEESSSDSDSSDSSSPGNSGDDEREDDSDDGGDDDKNEGGNLRNGEIARTRRKDKIDSWDIRFLDEQEPATLFDLLVAAKDLGIKVLLDMTCKLVYGLMKDQTPQEVRQNCGISCSDMALMEIEKIIKENDE